VSGHGSPGVMNEDHLERIRRLLKERNVYWSAYNPDSPYLYDVEDAGDDIRWLLGEVERLGGRTGRRAGARGRRR